VSALLFASSQWLSKRPIHGKFGQSQAAPASLESTVSSLTTLSTTAAEAVLRAPRAFSEIPALATVRLAVG